MKRKHADGSGTLWDAEGKAFCGCLYQQLSAGGDAGDFLVVLVWGWGCPWHLAGVEGQGRCSTPCSTQDGPPQGGTWLQRSAGLRPRNPGLNQEAQGADK